LRRETERAKPAFRAVLPHLPVTGGAMRKKDEKAAFEKAIEEDPFDGTTRKVFADWLEEHGFDDEALLQREWTPKKMRAAEKWLKKFAAECSDEEDENAEEEEGCFTLSYEALIQAGHKYLDTGVCLWLGIDPPNEEMEQFWQHFMVVTGRPVPSEKREDCFIRCAC
jgi:uncharacterized protein (TIGR02996 family)